MHGRVVALLIAVSLAGCLGADEPDPPAPTLLVLEGAVLDSADDSPLAGASLRLEVAGTSFETLSASDGSFRFEYPTPGRCQLSIERDGYSSGAIDLDCTRNRFLTVRASELVYSSPNPPNPPTAEEQPLIPGQPEERLWTLSGTVSLFGAPVPGARVVVEGPGAGTDTITDGNGAFRFVAPAGAYTLAASAPCATPATRTIQLSSDATVNLALPDADMRPPAAPVDVAVTPGPGIAQSTVAWQRPAEHGGAPVERFAIYRDGSLFTITGNTLAYGDTGASPSGHSYSVAAINGCGVEGEPSAEVSGAPIPGTLVPAGVSTANIATAVHTYDVYNANGNLTGTRSWRTTNEVGNCCETYVASSPSGRLFEYGGSTMYYTDDEGLTWSEVDNVLLALGAEGAIAGAPGGDIVAVNWDPYSGDQLWSHKYVAATDTWYTARTPLHQPFFDREWVAVIEGPFTVGSLTVPYVSFMMSNYVHGDILLVSLDGLHYQPPTQRMLTQLGGTIPFPTQLPPDPDRDWIQSMQETSVVSVDDGFGLRDRALTEFCDFAALTNNIQWGCPSWGQVSQPPVDNEVLRVDSKGNLHIFTVEAGETTIHYRFSRDLGVSWTYLQATVPNGLVVEDWDVQVNAALDQTAMVVHASETTEASTVDTDFVFRFNDFGTGPRLSEIMQVGLGDHVFGGGLGSEYDRFDYTTVAILASGHVAISFGDSEHAPPGIAIEME